MWRDGEDVRTNPDRALIHNLDDLPVPAFDAYPETRTASLYLDVGRGCPFKCQFCATAPFWERRFRMKSIERILEEMRLLRDRWGRRHVNFSHDIFTADRKWTQRFCDATSRAQLGVTWTCSTRTDTIDEGLLAQMANAGCVEIYYGIEAGAQAAQRQIKKHLKLDRSKEIVRQTVAVGIRPVTGFIVGYPFETEQTLSETISCFFDFLAVGGFRAHLFTLCPFHQSPMFREHESTIDRRAEYHDLPLTGTAAVTSEDLLGRHRDIFASAYRYATPSLEPALVAATEELSAHLVVLRRIWPLLLPHYESPLEWYRRWVAWIARDNLRRRPETRLLHQGDARDLLRFLSEEIVRLRLDESILGSLIRYETIKHAAAVSLPPGMPAYNGSLLSPTTPVVRACSYLAAPFRHNLRAFFGHETLEQDSEPREQPGWIVFAKTEDGALHTLQTNALACRLLELATTPQPLSELINNALLRRARTDDPQHVECREIVRKFIDRMLLSEIPT